MSFMKDLDKHASRPCIAVSSLFGFKKVEESPVTRDFMACHQTRVGRRIKGRGGKIATWKWAFVRKASTAD